MDLKFCRLSMNLRQVDLARKIGMHAPKLSLIENGLHQPSDQEKAKIERALRMKGFVDWGATAGKEKIGGRHQLRNQRDTFRYWNPSPRVRRNTIGYPISG
jgi:transcriptional regulator with XRE-family HTH domain